MADHGLFENLGLGVMLLLSLTIVLGSMEFGYRIGAFRHRRTQDEKEQPVGAVVGSTLGLLAFLLAFTFSFSASHFENRKHLVVEEANSIGTAWLRAGLLPEPEQTESRQLLQEYVGVRLDTVRSGQLAWGKVASEKLHQQLWQLAESAAEKENSVVRVGLYVQVLNELIDIHAERFSMVALNRIPTIIWLALFAETAIAMGVMGYHAGLTGTVRSWAALPIALAFSVLIALIADLDNPAHGFIRAGQQPLQDVQQAMESPQAEPQASPVVVE